MRPGPISIFLCPECRNSLMRDSILSGNFLDAEFYSDGKIIAIMFPDFPRITKCEKCDTIFWLDESNEFGYIDWFSQEKSEWKNSDYAKFLSIEDYFRALDEGIATDEHRECYIRQYIWWAYNDRIRKGENIFCDENDEIKWRENCIKLISILEENDFTKEYNFFDEPDFYIYISNIEKIMMIAELKRNLGDFEGCIETINKIDDDNAKVFKDILIRECNKGNRWVVKLN